MAAFDSYLDGLLARGRAYFSRDEALAVLGLKPPDLRLCWYLGLSDGWWLRLQADYDTEVAKAALAKIRPRKETAE